VSHLDSKKEAYKTAQHLSLYVYMAFMIFSSCTVINERTESCLGTTQHNLGQITFYLF